MKKCLNMILILCITISIFTVSPLIASASSASSGTCGDNLTWSLEGASLTISGSGDMDNWASSSEVPWNLYASVITNIVMDSSVTSIGDFAFSCFSNLQSFSTDAALSRIGNYDFYNNTSLSSATVPDTVTEIGSYAFTTAQE